VTSPGLPDLHRHLDGSLRPSTLARLAREAGIALPVQPRFTPGMGLDQALACFSLTLSVLKSPDAVRLVASQIAEDALAEGVTTLELRFAPQLHGGAPPAVIVDAALEGLAGRGGLILCGLYGEPPDLLSRLVAIAADRPGVVGLDLAGGPLPSHDFSMSDYEHPFAAAREAGLGCTVHAGEGRPPAEIRVAVELLGARRIGHGTTLLEDPEVVALLRHEEITVEACITSNWHVGAIADPMDHPAARWLDQGVRVTFCSDNTLLSATTAAREHELAAALPGMTPALWNRAVECGHQARFTRS